MQAQSYVSHDMKAQEVHKAGGARLTTSSQIGDREVPFHRTNSVYRYSSVRMV